MRDVKKAVEIAGGQKKTPAEAGVCVLLGASPALPRLASKPCVGTASFDITQIVQAILQQLKAKHRKVARHDYRRFVIVGEGAAR